MSEWIYGRNPVFEVLRAGRRNSFRLMIAQGVQQKGHVTDILRLCAENKIPVERVLRQQLDEYCDGHQGVVLETNGYSYCELQDILYLAEKLSEPNLVLILDTLQDPQNLGTLLRTAESVGVHGVLLPLKRSATITPAVVSASSGASEHLLIARANLARVIDMLKSGGVWVVGLETGREAFPPNQVRLDGPLALVVGSENRGMRKLVRDSCDFLMRLPMRGKVDSLNAAVAGSVALYMIWQARDYRSN